MIKKLSAVLVAFVLAAGTAAVAQDGLALMRVDVGARPAGMGGAFTAVRGTPDAVLYNPAGAAGVEDLAGSFGHYSYWENIRLESGYVGMRLAPRAVMHVGIRYAAIDELEKRTAVPTEEPLAMFDANDLSFKGGLSYRISERIYAGMALGWFFEKIDEWNGWAFNVDLGAAMQATERLALGAAVTNLGSDFELSRTSFASSAPIELPTTWRFGAAYAFVPALATLDLVYLDDLAHVHLGAEVRVHELLQVRSGYMTNYDTKNFTAGASFVQRNITVDYAFVPYKRDLGTTHMFNLTFTL